MNTIDPNQSPLASALGIALEQDQAEQAAAIEASRIAQEEAAAALLPVVIPTAEAIQEKKVDDDAELARQTLHDMIAKNNTAIDQLLQISRESMQPRAYEVLAALIRHNADISEKLLKIHNDKTIVANNTINLARNRNNFTGNSGAAGGNTTNIVNIDKAVFTGTTTELLELIRTAAPAQIEDQTAEDEDIDGN